jgi:hypothetical protein
MELIDQLHALESEINLVKGEIKKVLIDLRELMNTAENPFAYLEQLRVDEERLKSLEEAMKQLKELGGVNGFEGERMRTLEDALEQLKEIVTGILEDKIKNLEGNVQDLKEQGGVEVEKLKNLEPDFEMMAEPEQRSGSLIIRKPVAPESELIVVGNRYGNEIVDTITLAQLIQWADTTVNLIGMEKLSQVVDLLELTGRISKETKDTIFKIAKLPDVVYTPEKEHIEAKDCIIALFELNRILTGSHQELSSLLKDSLLRSSRAK